MTIECDSDTKSWHFFFTLSETQLRNEMQATMKQTKIINYTSCMAICSYFVFIFHCLSYCVHVSTCACACTCTCILYNAFSRRNKLIPSDKIRKRATHIYERIHSFDAYDAKSFIHIFISWRVFVIWYALANTFCLTFSEIVSFLIQFIDYISFA